MPVATPDLDERVEEAQETDKPWNVILWNDPVNLFDHVIRTLMAAPFGHPQEKAELLTLTVHNNGKAIVSHTDSREEAELHVEALTAATLWATIERS